MTESFNPFNRFRGFMVPNWLARRNEVSHGAKLCYGRLVQFNGRSGRCNPRESVLGKELAVSERTCRRFLTELQRHGLIRIHHTGLRRSNSYEFLRHPWMTDFLADKTDRAERPKASAPDRTEVAVPSGRDSVEGESIEESTPLVPFQGTECSSKDFLSQAEEIYALYPNQIGKPAALRAIERAIKRRGFDAVINGTRLYAQTYNGEPRFIPSPTKFFNQERFMDDPATWNRGRKAGGQNVQVTKPSDYPSGRVQL